MEKIYPLILSLHKDSNSSGDVDLQIIKDRRRLLILDAEQRIAELQEKADNILAKKSSMELTTGSDLKGQFNEWSYDPKVEDLDPVLANASDLR